MFEWKRKEKLRELMTRYSERFSTNTVPNDKYFMLEMMVELYAEMKDEVEELRERIKWSPTAKLPKDS